MNGLACNPLQVTVAHSGAQTASSSGESGAIIVTLSQAGDSLSNGMVSLYAEGTAPGPLQATFTPSGTYWVHTTISQHGLCLASFTAGGANLAREPLVVGTAGVTAPLDLTLRDDCAQLTLMLPAAGVAPASGEELWYTVYVVPDFDSTENIVPQTLRPSSGGSYTVEGLTPGSYHVYTLTGPSRVVIDVSHVALGPFPGIWNTTTPPFWARCPRRARPSPSRPEPRAASYWRCPRDEQKNRFRSSPPRLRPHAALGLPTSPPTGRSLSHRRYRGERGHRRAGVPGYGSRSFRF